MACSLTGVAGVQSRAEAEVTRWTAGTGGTARARFDVTPADWPAGAETVDIARYDWNGRASTGHSHHLQINAHLI